MIGKPRRYRRPCPQGHPTYALYVSNDGGGRHGQHMASLADYRYCHECRIFYEVRLHRSPMRRLLVGGNP